MSWDQIAVGVVSIIVAQAIISIAIHIRGQRNLLRQLLRRERFTVCEPKSGQAINVPFYEEYLSRVSAASESIWIVGEGVHMQPVEKELMEAIVQEILKKLSDPDLNFTYHRLQTSRDISSKYAELLRLLLRSYPTKVFLYFVPPQIAYTMAIDPGRIATDSACIEALIPYRKFLDGADVEIAGLGVFAYGRAAEAKYVQERMHAITKHAISVEKFINAMSLTQEQSRLPDTIVSALPEALIVQVSTPEELDRYLGYFNAPLD